jgi:siderophore synthetase component
MMGTEWQVRISEAVASPAYDEVKRRVIRQLLEALIFEGIVQVDRREFADHGVFTIHGKDEAGRSVSYVCRGEVRFTFGRIRLHIDTLQRHSGEQAMEVVELELKQLVKELLYHLGLPLERIHAFIQELEHTLLNDTLAQYRRAQESITLQGQPYDRLESILMSGHPYHPCYKSRIGFDVVDQEAYGPEFEADIRPLWLALKNTCARVQVIAGLDYRSILRDELGETVLARLDSRVREHGCDPADYIYAPVHPWQWRKRIVPGFLSKLRSGTVILLGESEDVYRAQQSIRTLANYSSPSRSCMKLSIHMRNTSSSRHLTPHTIASAPFVSSWLQGAVDSDSYLADEAQVILLREFAGVYYEASPTDGDAYGAIGCIWRESLHRYMRPGEAAVPMNGLTAFELDGAPFIDPWIKRWGTEAWLQRLLEVCLLPIVHLFAAHGLALESHAQNVVLLHRDGMPCRVALKDFHEGVEYTRHFVREPERCPDFTAIHEYYRSLGRNAAFEMESSQLVKELVVDCLFFMNLGELALLLAEHYELKESRFWALVVRVLEEHLERFPELGDRFREIDWWTPTCRVECLAGRRIMDDHELLVHEVPNPLYQAAKSIREVDRK